MFAVRGSLDHYNAPKLYSTSVKAGLFFTKSLGLDPGDVATKFEGYCISGVQGIADAHREELLTKSADTSRLILEKLREYQGLTTP